MVTVRKTILVTMHLYNVNYLHFSAGLIKLAIKRKK